MLHYGGVVGLGQAMGLSLIQLASYLHLHHDKAVNLSPQELKAMREEGQQVRLIDVREQDEWDTVHLEGAELIPLSQFQRLAPEKLDLGDPIVVYCHHGMRSAQAQGYLKSQGYTNVLNLTGGIDAWSLQVDPTVKRY